MSTGFCGRECEVCTYFESCAGCWNRMCLLARCLRGTTFEGITTPRPFCIYRKICHRRVGAKTRPAPPQPPKIEKHREQSKIDLPLFVPTIEIGNPSSWFWPDVKATTVIVRLGEILVDSKLGDEVCRRGLHGYLGFDGHVMLSTVMPDELLDRLTIDELKVLIKELQPDSCMIPDCYTYIDDPQLMSWRQLFKMLGQAQGLLDQDIPIVGLVKGASRRQFVYCTEQLLRMGLTTLAFPARELAEAKLLESFISNVTDILQEKKADVKLIIYGLSYPIHRFPWGKTSYASMSWHIDSKYAYYYWNGLRYPAGHTSVRFNMCDCPSCRQRLAYEVASHRRDLAIHNLIELEKRFMCNAEADE